MSRIPSTWSTVGPLSRIALAFFLILFGATILIGVAIPGWVGAVLAIVAGILLLVGL